MLMDCRTCHRYMPALLDGDLRPAQVQDVRLHVETCPACLDKLNALDALLRSSDEALTYRGAPLAFADLRSRMAAIEPLEQVLRYQLPKLCIPGAAPRFAVAMLLLIVLAGLPYAFRHSRKVYASVKTPFAQQEATLLAALDEDRFPGEALPPVEMAGPNEDRA